MPKKISALNPELLLRHRPRQLRQRRPHLERIHCHALGRAKLPQAHAPLHRVLRMPLHPVGNVGALPLLLAGRGRTNPLAVANAGIRGEPTTADSTRA